MGGVAGEFDFERPQSIRAHIGFEIVAQTIVQPFGGGNVGWRERIGETDGVAGEYRIERLRG